MLVTSWRYGYRALRLIAFSIRCLIAAYRAKRLAKLASERMLIIPEVEGDERTPIPHIYCYADIKQDLREVALQRAVYDTHPNA